MKAERELTAADWHRLNRLLAEALDLDAAERDAWLAALPEDTGDLKPLLTDLLATGSDGEAVSETLQPVVDLAMAALSSMRDDEPGDRVGPWRLERLLAEGGMGAVWIAQRADGVMQRTAALKLPRAEWIDRGLAQRIARERAILARLQHPHIAVLYDAGLGEGGRPYLALEYVDGVPVDAWCRGRDLRSVLRLMVQVARAVAYAHGQLVIHRDLKPANVLVTADGAPKLLDFGISKLMEGDTAAAADATALTRMAGRPLTLAYAAPEQILGLSVTVTADVYALGVMLFELLTGSRLYRATTPRALEAEVLQGDLRRPSDAASDPPRARALRGDLDAIVGTALKRDPAERYASAAAFADDVERFLQDKPVRARPDTRVYRLGKFLRRNALPVAAGGAIVAALGIGLGVALWQADTAREQAARATALNTFVLGLIRTADPNASQQTRAADLAMLGAIEQRIDAEFAGAPDQRLQLQVTIGDAYRNRGELAAARRVYLRAAQQASAHLPENHLPLLRARVQAADYRLILSKEAAVDLDRAIAILRTTGSAGADLLIEALHIREYLGNVYGIPELTPWDRRFDPLNEARDVAIRHYGIGSRQHVGALMRLERANFRSGHRKESLQLMQEALAAAQARGGDVLASPEYRGAQWMHLSWRCANGDTQARLAMQELVAAERAAHGDHSVQLEEQLSRLRSCAELNTDPTYRRVAEDVYAVAAARERPPSTNLMERASGAFATMLALHDYEAAERYYQLAMENAEVIVEDDSRARLTRMLQMQRVCLLVRRLQPQEAERLAAPLVAALDEEYARIPRLTPGQAALWGCLSQAQRDNGRFDEAMRTARTYLERCQAMKFPMSEYCLPGYSSIALTQLETGRHQEAMATLEQTQAPGERWEDFRLFDFAIAFGRAALANGRPAEALEPLQLSYGRLLSAGATHTMVAAENLYWFGQARIANGEGERGRRMVAQAQRQLADSPLPRHQELAARTQ